ncbi:SusC/RagA family TonB-linked outer membrane protein [Niabella soli]|uniref:TonB-dependent receptor n=1 Tax=Niabella soli DSM 19437 TaxID=929713 RepID=W0F4E4_9BACT|nr:TonB-dependent receptor [Niabella soli]AHF16191.1 TonB-dependent receptor [Niabella soli DSM 19437]
MKKAIMLFLLVSILAVNAIGQKRITGIVTDENSQPISGVSVLVKGTNTGTVTDTVGKYSIPVHKGQTLVFSFVGNSTEERVVGSQSTISVSLKNTSSLLQEVVVGYGVQKKAEVTGAVATIDVKKALDSRPVPDLARALQGVSPGLLITTSSGNIGQSPEIHLRGVDGSVNADAKPLILLDNVPIPDMMMVNPEDIESISVLKDAASASIYGARGSWGVILLTSKKGRKGQVRISYDNNFAWSSPMNTPQIADGAAGAEYMLRQYRRTAPNTASFNILGAYYDDLSIERMRQWKALYGGMDLGPEMVEGRDFERRNGQTYYYRAWDIDNLFLNDASPQMKHNLSISGGDSKTTYYASFGAMDQRGLVKVAPKPDRFTRFNGTVRVETKINKWFTARTSLMSYASNKQYPQFRLAKAGGGGNEYWFNIYRYPETYPYGTFNGLPLKNILNELQQAHINTVKGDQSRLQAGATLTFLKGWTADVDYTYSVNNSHDNVATAPISGINSWVDPTLTSVLDNYFPAEDYVIETSRWIRRNVGKAYTTYNKTIGGHSFKLMAGSDIEYYISDFQTSEADGLMLPSKPTLNLTSGAEFANGYPTHWSTLGYFGRLNYAYKNKYLLEANLRRDGASNFPVNKKWATFPSFSAGYILSNEKFMDGVKDKLALSFLKIRGSWGSIGNNDIGNNSYIRTMTAGSSNWWINGLNPTMVGEFANVSDALTWETIQTTDLGLNARFFKDALSIDFDVFNRATKGMVTTGVEAPSSLGSAPSKRNFGELVTKGWELAITYNKQFSNGIGFNVMGSLSDATGRITKFANTEVSILPGGNDVPNYQGKEMGEIWGYTSDRLFTNADFTGNNGAGNPIWYYDPKTPNQDALNSSSAFHFGPGDVKYKDLNGDGVVDYGGGTNLDHGDMHIIGNTTPRYLFGFRVGLNYKGFDFSGFLQGVGKRDYWATGSLFIPGFTQGEAVYQNQMNYWTPEHPDAFYPAPSNPSANNHNANWQSQTRYLLNMAYIRVKNLSLGYTIPVKLLHKVGLNRARIFASGENLFTIDHVTMPIDPEIQQNSVEGFNDAKSFGRTYPYFKTWSFGVQVDL